MCTGREQSCLSLFAARGCGKEGTMRNWKSWFKAAGIRAVKTFCQTAVAMLPASAMINEVGWLAVFFTSALAAIASLLTSLAGIPEEELE